MEFPDDILRYICDLTDLSYTPYFKLLTKTASEHVDLQYKIYKMISFINKHYESRNLGIMHQTGLITHTNKLKNKINMNKHLLQKHLCIIENKYLCTYLTQYFQRIEITTHSVILNLL